MTAPFSSGIVFSSLGDWLQKFPGYVTKNLDISTLMVPIHVRVWLAVRLGEIDSGARLGYISPHTHEWIPKLCSYISVSRMSSSKQVAAAVIILDECGVFGRKIRNRKRRDMWAKKWF